MATLETALSHLYAREINVRINLLYDAGITVRVKEAEREFRPEEFEEIGDWLLVQAGDLAPEPVVPWVEND